MAVYRSNYKILSVFYALSVVIYTALVYVGLNYTTVVNGALLNALVPVLIVLLAHFMLKECLSVQKTIGLILSLFGAAMLILHGDLAQVSHLNISKGSVFILIYSIAWTLFYVLLKKTPKDYHL